MKVLVINAGSSSLKYQLLDMDTEEVLAKGLAERIGIDGSNVTYQPAGEEKIKIETPLKDHKDALDIIISKITDPDVGVIESVDEIDAVGHRTVHGGEAFANSVVINDDVIKTMEENSELAPLHNPANLTGIRAMEELLPGVPEVAVFDTAFHQSMPEYAYMYALPYELYEDLHIRKYGFHGTSHKYVSIEAAKMLGKPVEELKIITCHLGNGGSITAVEHGKSVDTSMGFTPLAGIEMGTRSGDIDPAIVIYLQKKGYTVEEVDDILNTKSGAYGVSGVSSDFRDLEEAAEEGNKRAKLALDIFCYRVRCTIGAYVAAMDGVDAIVFTGGIGENAPETREQVCEGLKYLGITIDPEANKVRGKDKIITTPDSKVKVLVIPTNEELMIARDTVELTENL